MCSPARGRPPSSSLIDEATCYNWAVQNTGTDPFALEKQAQQQQAQAQQQQQQIAASGQGAGCEGRRGRRRRGRADR